MRIIFSRVFLAILMLFAGAQLALAARTTTYFHTDGLGSVVAASDQAGAVLWRKTYAPFGQQTDTQPDNERLSYTGKPHDDVTGLSYFGGRYYDPAIGRFASVDPVGFVESNPMSFNRYLYVNNNPYKYVDPDGEFLNFAAKFVFDVGLNIAFNYATSGSFGVGSALKESAVGVLNPAKTVAKAGKLVAVLAKAKKGASGGGNFIFRAGSGTARNMTPRPKDVTGLSAADSLENSLPGPNQVIDTSKLVNLCAICDNPRTGHVSIKPKDPAQMAGWIASRESQNVHPLTKELMDAVVGTVKK